MFIDEDGVEDRIGRDRLLQIFDRNLDNEADEVPLQAAIADANAEIYARLNKKGYSEEQLVELARDETVRRAAAMIVAEFGAMGKPELIGDNGETYYTKIADKMRVLIDSIAATTFRPRAEATAGRPESTKANVSHPHPDFQISPTPERPRGRGMF